MKAISSLLLAMFFAWEAHAQTPPSTPKNISDVSAGDSVFMAKDTLPSAATVAEASENQDQIEGDSEEEEESETGDPQTPMLAFLIPADGDVFYTPDIKIVAYVQGSTPAGMLAVLDGFSLNRPLGLEDGIFNVELQGLSGGVHEIKVIFLDEKQQIQLSRTVRFFIRLPEPYRKPMQGKLRQFGRVLTRLDWKGAEAKGRILKQTKILDSNFTTGSGEIPISQNLDGALEGSYSVKYDQWEGFLKGLIRSDENKFRQPSHRGSGKMSYGPWASIHGGDIYPVYNPLILNGTRLRGGEASLALVTDEGEKRWVYGKMASGESKRQISAHIAEYDTGNGSRKDTISGTPEQVITAYRIGAGGGSNFDLGLTIMHAADRVGDPNFRAVNDSLRGISSLDNLVTGLDLRIGFWDGRIQIWGSWATSLYTHDRSIGAFDDTTSDLAFSAKDFDKYFIINQSTAGWQYLLESDSATGRKMDLPGFINANSAREASVTTSIPFAGIVSETEIHYSYLGNVYHSEGNPFLGTNPGEGLTYQQRLIVMENRLLFGLEGSNFVQDLGLYKQDERGLKGEIRFLPGAYQPAFWVNGGLTVRTPRGNYPYKFTQDFTQANIGGFHQVNMGPGKLHGSLLYGLTRSELDLQSTSADTTIKLLTFPVTLTHIVNTSMQYKLRGLELTPRMSYTFASNGIQSPTNNVVMGFQNAFFNQQLRLDFDVYVGQYPKSFEKNDLSLGESLGLLVRIGEGQNVRLREKWIQYGTRTSMNAGAYYEAYF